MNTRHILLSVTALLAAVSLHAQTSELGQTKKNYISTGMPVLMIAPDAASSALGDAGVASEPDAYSSHWNNAKYAFIRNDWGISTTYTPWLKKLGVGDMHLLYLGGYKRINNRMTAAASITYFSMGDIEKRNEFGDSQGNMHPNEFAIDLTFSMKLSEHFSMGASARLNHSDLTNGADVGNQTTKAANMIAADLGFYYERSVENAQQFALGLLISNLGGKLSYSNDDTDKEFLPANLRLGGRYTKEFDESNKLNLLLDINKLLVATPPVQKTGESDADYRQRYNDYRRMSSMESAFKALYDAPRGFSEKLQELQISAGAEYWYRNFLAVRLGYFYENDNKGGRQYLTTGVGIRYKVFAIDFSYLVPTTNFNNNPLTNTIRIGLSVNFESQRASVNDSRGV